MDIKLNTIVRPENGLYKVYAPVIIIFVVLFTIKLIYYFKSISKKRGVKTRINTRINNLFKRYKVCRILLDQRVNKLYKKSKKHSDKIFERINAIEHDLNILEKEHDEKKKLETKNLEERKKLETKNLEEIEEKKKIFIDFCEHWVDGDYLTKNLMKDMTKNIYFRVLEISSFKFMTFQFKIEPRIDQITCTCIQSIYDYVKYQMWKCERKYNQPIEPNDLIFIDTKLKEMKMRELYCENNNMYYKINVNFYFISRY